MWYYVDEGKQQGPVAPEVIGELLKSGRIGDDTLVWTDGMPEWVQLHKVRERIFGATCEQVVPPDTAPVIMPYEPEIDYECPQIRPWVRYWARSIDMLLFGFLSGIIIGAVSDSFMDINDVLFGVLITFGYVFVEPVMLAAWGTTPGKALFKVYLNRAEDSSITYQSALRRSFNVWLRGLGMGIPVVALVTQINAYKKLTSEGITSWDRDCGYSVTHGRIGPVRIAAAVLLMIVFAMLMAAGTAG